MEQEVKCKHRWQYARENKIRYCRNCLKLQHFKCGVWETVELVGW